MSKDEPLLSNCPLETAEPSRNYARVPGYKKIKQEKDKKKTRKEKKNERRRNQYARIRRYKLKITSTLGLLVRGDPQNEDLRGLQPRALGSKLDYFHAGITSTRLHRISGYPDVRDPDIFGALTRVGSKRIIKYANAFFFGQVACLQTLFHYFLLFVDVCWLDDKVKVLFGKFSY